VARLSLGGDKKENNKKGPRPSGPDPHTTNIPHFGVQFYAIFHPPFLPKKLEVEQLEQKEQGFSNKYKIMQ
jgi:hypothetical protein